MLLLVGTLSAAGSGVPFPLMGIIFGQLLDDLNQATCETKASPGDAKDVQDAVNEKVLILVYIGIAAFVLIYVYVVSWSIFSRRVETRLRDRYFKTLLRQDASFFDTRQAGELASRLNADIQAVQSGTSEKVGMCIACISFFLTAYIVSFTRNWKLACMLISLIPAFLLMAAVGSAFTQKFTMAMSDAIASASSVAQETLSHIAVVQAFSAGPRLEGRFASRVMDAQKHGIKKAFAAAVQAGTLYFIAFSANALAYWQGSRAIVGSLDNDDGTSVGDIYTVIFLLVDGKWHHNDRLMAFADQNHSLHHSWLRRTHPAYPRRGGCFLPKAAPGYRNSVADRFDIGGRRETLESHTGVALVQGCLFCIHLATGSPCAQQRLVRMPPGEAHSSCWAFW